MSTLLSTQSVIGIILEIVVVLVILVAAFIGLKKGFLQSVLSIFTTSIVLVVSVFTAKFGAQLLEKLFGFVSFMGRQMGKVLGSMADGVLGTVFGEGATVAEANAIIEGTDLFGPLKTLLKNSVAENSNNLVGNSIANMGGQSLGAIVSMIIAGIIIFLLLKLILFLLSKLFENLTANKVLGTPDKILGLIFGVAKGALIIFVYAGVLIVLTLIPTVNNFISPIIQEHTYVTRFIYNATDGLVEKHIINNIDDWVNDLWDNRSPDNNTTTTSQEVSAMPPIVITIPNEVA
ncbi:MAG: CvpA family protein [Clostridia bacterium]|nr:CvpA family protein [Clostridia bacterium]